LTPPSRLAFPSTTPAGPVKAAASAPAAARGGRGILRFVFFVLFVGAAAAAFYAGTIYQRQRHAINATANAQPSPAAVSTLTDKRAAVDADPQKWISDNVQSQLARESISKPIDSKDPEFLYLYGRALTQTGDHRSASEAFSAAINNVRSEKKPALSLESELKLADAAATLKMDKASPGSQTQQTAMAEDKAIRILDETLGLKREAPQK